MNEETELLREIRDLLLVMAEPALAKRDEKHREALLKIVGKSKLRAKAVMLMDGIKVQSQLKSESGIDQGDLSRCVKALREAGLINKDEKPPKLFIAVPPNFFEKIGEKLNERIDRTFEGNPRNPRFASSYCRTSNSRS
jgi:hypothetical protein